MKANTFSFVSLFLGLFIGSISAQDTNSTVNYLPTVMWHGMGDSCCNPFSLGRIKRIIEQELPGIYVYSVKIGDNVIADTEHGFIGNVNDHVQEACDEIASDPLLQGGFNALGFSQGSQFLRALVQRCPFHVRNLVNLGAQHQGVFGLPHCPGLPQKSRICEYFRKLLNKAAYDKSVQNHLVQAQYWHDPLEEETYKNYSIFLADINNEKTQNEDYKNNLLKLENIVMAKFLQDSMVIPRESSWFGFYAPGQDTEVLPLQQTTLYTEDRLGLKTLDEAQKLQFLEVEGDHLQFSDQWFIDEIVGPYLSTEV